MTVLEGIVTKAGVMGKTVTVTVSPLLSCISDQVEKAQPRRCDHQVSRKVVHPILLKEMKRHKKFLVHDEHERELIRPTFVGGKSSSD